MKLTGERLLNVLLLALFCVLAARAAGRAVSLAKAAGQVELNTARLEAEARDAAELSRDVVTGKEEADFFSSLLAANPQNKSYLRSQKAIAEEVAELRREAGRRLGGALHIAVDTRANKLYLKRGLRLLWAADCSVGRGGVIKDRKTGRTWQFATPRGEFRVITKIDKPAWLKPDWAYVESGQPVPPPDDVSRRVEGELGAYALNIGDGYLLHGTKNEADLGRPVSHGCIRLGAADLEKLYKAVPTGTKVYIY